METCDESSSCSISILALMINPDNLSTDTNHVICCVWTQRHVLLRLWAKIMWMELIKRRFVQVSCVSDMKVKLSPLPNVSIPPSSVTLKGSSFDVFLSLFRCWPVYSEVFGCCQTDRMLLSSEKASAISTETWTSGERGKIRLKIRLFIYLKN